MQVYAVLYSDKGDFLMGRKPKRGYFFHDSSDGKIYPKGVSLNGAEKPALPGGKLEGKDIVAGAQKEFQEECGAKISFSDSALIIEQQEYELQPTNTWVPSGAGYCAVFFKVVNVYLGEIAYIIQETNLRQAIKAVEKISNKEITAYKDIFNKYPYCPPDNELDMAEIWNLERDKGKIAELKDDKATDWFYAILMCLEKILTGC